MNLQFDLQNITLVEFGIARDDGNGPVFFWVPVDASVQSALIEMAQKTWAQLQAFEGGPSRYEPSDKHSSAEYLYLPVADEMVASVRGFHEAVNLPIDSTALSDPGNLFCYFARFTDNQQRKLTALRRASQFKGILQTKGRLIRLIDNTLRVVEDKIFRLDHDFDLLIDADNLHILRPAGFEFTGRLQNAILQAVPGNVAAIKNELPFVMFESVERYAVKHPRAARYLASICQRKGMMNIDKNALRRLCKQTLVVYENSNGKMLISPGHELGFLEVLDRRRYELELVKGKPERFKAASRKAIE